MRTRACIIKKNSEQGLYFSNICRRTKALRNTTNFYIRNTYTGIAKSPEERTHNETEVLHFVFTGIQKYNARKEELYVRDMWKARLTGGLRGHTAAMRAVRRAKSAAYPSRENRMLSYEILDTVFKFTDNQDYRRLPAQVNQAAMKKTFRDWKGYFAALADWKRDPGKYKARPQIPGYIQSEETTACFTNQTAKLWVKANGKNIISFIGTKVTAGCGSIPGTYIRTEVKPYHGDYRLLITYDNKAESPEAPENPARILGIDLGVDNLIAAAGNYGSVPFLIKGGYMKSMNQWFNKQRARLLSELTKGKNSSHSIKNSKRLDAISRKRDERIRDFFCKCAHYICRRAVKDGVEVIVIGHNKGIKNGVGFRKKDNQNFVCIPELKLIGILEHTAVQYGIPVVVTEESYTSKASAVDRDEIRVYGSRDTDKVLFSGKRVKRGLYRTKDGCELNADVNGAANIIRKAYPDAFRDVKDFSYLWKTTEAVRYRDIYKVLPVSEKRNAGKRPRPGKDSRRRHFMRSIRRRELKEAFPKIKASTKEGLKTAS